MRERLSRISQVHQDRGARPFEGAQLDAFDAFLEQPFVDATLVAFRAGNRDLFPVRHCRSCVAGADHGRNAHLAADDRGVTSSATAISDDAGRPLEYWFPVG